MQTVKGNIWDYYNKGYVMVVPVNQTLGKNGNLIMGAGLAYQVKRKKPDVAYKLALLMQAYKMGVVYLATERLIAFPTKKHWSEDSSPELILKSLRQLREWFHAQQDRAVKIVLPAVGCGCGNLDWRTEVKPLLEAQLLEDNFTVVLKDEMFDV